MSQKNCIFKQYRWKSTAFLKQSCNYTWGKINQINNKLITILYFLITDTPPTKKQICISTVRVNYKFFMRLLKNMYIICKIYKFKSSKKIPPPEFWWCVKNKIGIRQKSMNTALSVTLKASAGCSWWPLSTWPVERWPS